MWLALFSQLLTLSSFAQSAEEVDISDLPEEEAYRLLFLTPDGAPWPEGMVIQWEANRGQLRVYITNRTDETLYLDWGKSRFSDASGHTYALKAGSQEYPTREPLEPASPYQESLSLVDGPAVLYTPSDLGRAIQVSLSLGGTDGFSPYNERFLIDAHMDQVARSMHAEGERDLEIVQRRSAWYIVMGTVIAGAGTFLLVDQELAIRDGEIDDQINNARLAVGGSSLGLGSVITLVSIGRLASASSRLTAMETQAPLE